MAVGTGEQWMVLQAQCQRLSEILNRLCRQAMELLPLDRTAEGSRLQKEMLSLRLMAREAVRQGMKDVKALKPDLTLK